MAIQCVAITLCGVVNAMDWLTDAVLDMAEATNQIGRMASGKAQSLLKELREQEKRNA